MQLSAVTFHASLPPTSSAQTMALTLPATSSLSRAMPMEFSRTFSWASNSMVSRFIARMAFLPSTLVFL